MFSQALACSTSVALRRRCGGFGERQPNEGGSLQLHVPQSVRLPPLLSPLGAAPPPVPFADALRLVRSRCLPSDFQWLSEKEWLLQVNNSSGEASSRAVASKEAAKREIDNWGFMFFRVRRGDYKMNVKTIKGAKKSLFEDTTLDIWTHKYFFKIKRGAAFKSAALAFTSRMGITNSKVIFCKDGFYGCESGKAKFPDQIPTEMVEMSSNMAGLSLLNGSNIYVSIATDADLLRVEQQLCQQKAALMEKARQQPSDEYDYMMEEVAYTPDPAAST